MPAVSGARAKTYLGGTPTTFSAEATTNTSGKTYQITNAAKRVLDPATAVVVKDNGVAVPAADIASLNYLNGSVTFTSGYTPTTPITFDSGKYVPLELISTSLIVNEFEVDMKMTLASSTAQGDTVKRGVPTILAVTMNAKLISQPSDVYDGGTATLEGDILSTTAPTAKLVEFDPDGAGVAVFRGWEQPSDMKVSGTPEDVSRLAYSYSSGMNQPATAAYPMVTGFALVAP